VNKSFLVGVGVISAGLALATPAAADTFGSGANSFEIEFVTIGQPGNPGTPTGRSGQPNPVGSVPYSYRIGKYEISEQMIDKANALGALGITKDTRGPNKPATGVSWLEAAEFINWLNVSSGNTPAYKVDGAGELELWQPSDLGYNSNNRFRNRFAKYFLPSLDEWQKSAYYHPQSGAYFKYPTGSDFTPIAVSSGVSMGTAVFSVSFTPPGPADITMAGGINYYGTMAQGGNVAEWNETNYKRSLGVKGYSGGSWLHTSSNFVRASFEHTNNWAEDSAMWLGFRVASAVPEPTSPGMLGTALFMLLGRRQGSFSMSENRCLDPNLIWTLI
jgi:hypothetical protein